MPLHFAEARANVLTNDAGDMVTGTAEYKVCAVEIAKAEDSLAAEALFPGAYGGVAGPGPGAEVEPVSE
jgi:predicted molibdopterin-dependent oxidoreductase YjgC